MSTEKSQVDTEKKTNWNKDVSKATTQHEITCKGRQIKYEATVSQILLDSPKDEKVKNCAKMGYTAYLEKNQELRNKPLMFCYNGGPGSASLWLHLGALGPYRIDNLDKTSVANKTSSNLIVNEHTLLDEFDLVFVDPIGTGFSTTKDKESESHFYADMADAHSFAQFIHRFLDQGNHWSRSIYLCGESYGGYRSAFLCKNLIADYGIFPRGLFLVAPYLFYGSIEEIPEHVVARANFMCSFAVTAWYHSRSSLNKSADSAEEAYSQAKEFFFGSYLQKIALMRFSRCSKQVQETTAKMIGISLDVLLEEDDAFNVRSFSKHLLRNETRYPGRLDSRFTMSFPVEYVPKYRDPSLTVLECRMTQLTNCYFRNSLKVTESEPYKHFGKSIASHWKSENFSNSSESALSESLKENPEMKIYATSGYYDLAVSTAGVSFDLDHLQVPEECRKNIVHERFEAGHMMYVEAAILGEMVESAKNHFRLRS